MHDVLEGALQYELKELLKYLVFEVRLLSTRDLSNKIEFFPYGYADIKNKPTTITSKSLSSTDHALKQTGILYKMFTVYIQIYFMYFYLICSFSIMVPCKVATSYDW